MRLLAGVALALPAIASAQRFADSSRFALSLSYGSFEYDLSGTGKSRMLAIRVERPMAKYVLAEAGILYARPHDQSGDTSHYFVPEIQVQLQLPLGRVAPYLGVGGGLAWDSGRQRVAAPQQRTHITDPTISTSGGIRTWFTQVFGARAEARVRGIGGEFTGRSVEWTIGATLKL